MIVRTDAALDGLVSLCLWCPACEELHRIVTGGANSWTWDGDRERPTISPSILVHATQWAPEFSFHRPNHRIAPGERTTCHSFVVAGQWQFLPDCTHTLAGQTVPCVPIPDGYFESED